MRILWWLGRKAPFILAVVFLAAGVAGSVLVSRTFSMSDCSSLVCGMPMRSPHILVHNQYYIFVPLPSLLGSAFALVVVDCFGMTDHLVQSALGESITARRGYRWHVLANKLQRWNQSLLLVLVVVAAIDVVLFGISLHQGSQA